MDDPTPGVAVTLRDTGGARLWVTPDNVWTDGREWWPCTAAAIALHNLRRTVGPRALCLPRNPHNQERPTP